MDSLDYYERYAGVYFESTVHLKMDEILDRFLAELPENAEVLDLGCGSGRDSLYLEEHGCYTTLLDGSAEMCKLAEIHTDKEVLQMTFKEIDFDQVFDGIWACASLLHVPKAQIDEIMTKVTAALKPGGVLYMSFRYGEGEEIRGQRFFHDYTEESAYTMIRQHHLKSVDIWQTEDARSREDIWLNILVKKAEETTNDDGENERY